MQEYIGLIIAVAVVFAVIVLQFSSFLKTKKRIVELRDLFKEVDNLSLKETSITSDILRDKFSLQKFLANIPSRIEDEEGFDEDSTDLSLIVFQKEECLKDGWVLLSIEPMNTYAKIQGRVPT